MENGNEGIGKKHFEIIDSLSESIIRNGAIPTCVMAFGSRARKEGSNVSDLDLFILVDFDTDNKSLLSDRVLFDAKHLGQTTTSMNGPAGKAHIFLYNINGFASRLEAHDLKPSSLFGQLAQDGIVLMGKEPVINELSMKEYLRNRLQSEDN